MSCFELSAKSICDLAKELAKKDVLRDKAFATSTECPMGCWVWVITRFTNGGVPITTSYLMNDMDLTTPLNNVLFIDENAGPIITATVRGYAFDTMNLEEANDYASFPTVYTITSSSGSESVVNSAYVDKVPNLFKSEWYVDVVNAVNAMPDWSMTLITDMPIDEFDSGDNSKCLYEFTYMGQGASQLTIVYEKPAAVGMGPDTYIIDVDASGTITIVGSDEWGPFGTPIQAA